MIRVFVLVFLTLTAAADVRFGSEQIAAPPSVGFTSPVSTSYPITVTPGDGVFLVTWHDGRVATPGGGGLAMRVDASGRALDAHPIALPFPPTQTM